METYTKVPNTIIELMMSNLITESEKQILAFVARKTYGFHKDKDRISLTQFEKATGLSRQGVVDALTRLVKRGLLVKKDGIRNIPNLWSINDSAKLSEVVKPTRLVQPRWSSTLDTQKRTKEKLLSDSGKRLEYWDNFIAQALTIFPLSDELVIHSARQAFGSNAKYLSINSIIGFLKIANGDSKKQKGEYGDIKSL